MEKEDNHEEEMRKNYEDLKNGNYELWFENNENKFIYLCETSDYVMVNGHLGTYVKEYETIIFPRNGMCPPNIKVRDYDYYEDGGEKWISFRNRKDRRYLVRFLNEVKN